LPEQVKAALSVVTEPSVEEMIPAYCAHGPDYVRVARSLGIHPDALACAWMATLGKFELRHEGSGSLVVSDSLDVPVTRHGRPRISTRSLDAIISRIWLLRENEGAVEDDRKLVRSGSVMLPDEKFSRYLWSWNNVANREFVIRWGVPPGMLAGDLDPEVLRQPEVSETLAGLVPPAEMLRYVSKGRGKKDAFILINSAWPASRVLEAAKKELHAGAYTYGRRKVKPAFIAGRQTLASCVFAVRVPTQLSWRTIQRAISRRCRRSRRKWLRSLGAAARNPREARSYAELIREAKVTLREIASQEDAARRNVVAKLVAALARSHYPQRNQETGRERIKKRLLRGIDLVYGKIRTRYRRVANIQEQDGQSDSRLPSQKEAARRASPKWIPGRREWLDLLLCGACARQAQERCGTRACPYRSVLNARKHRGKGSAAQPAHMLSAASTSEHGSGLEQCVAEEDRQRSRALWERLSPEQRQLWEDVLSGKKNIDNLSEEDEALWDSICKLAQGLKTW
jgi:hypothetical protein